MTENKLYLGSDKPMELQRLQDQLSAIQNERERVAQQGLDTSILDATIRDVQQQIAEVESRQVRVQAQEEAVESITLPLDFNDLLENPLANEMVIEVVKQFQRQAYEEHNAEVTRINTEFKARFDELGNDYEKDIDLFNKRIIELQDSLNLADFANKDLNQNYGAIESRMVQIEFERDEALLCRDNAVREMEEAKEEVEKHKQSTIENCDLRRQIEDLKQELTAKKLTVNGNDKLAELANKAKESTIAKANRGLERWKEQYGLDIPVLESPEIEPVTEQVEATKEIPFQAGHELGEGRELDESHVSDETSEEAEESEVTATNEERISLLEAQVKRINNRLFPSLSEGLSYNDEVA